MNFSPKKIVYIAVFMLLAIVAWQVVLPFVKDLRGDVLTRRIAEERVSVNPELINVSLATTTLQIEIVATDEEREKGLSDRQFLDDDQGMLFLFDKDGYPAIWMKGMVFSIDIAWLDKDYRIVDIEKYVSPSTYPMSFQPDMKARYVLEVNAGYFDMHGIMPGAQLQYIEKEKTL